MEMLLSNGFYALNAEGTIKMDFKNLKKSNINISGQLSTLRK